MSPLVALHVTRVTCRESIRQRGLIPAQPRKGRPFGVYVYTDGNDFDHTTWMRKFTSRATVWAAGPRQDIWAVAYIGPLTVDRYVRNALIFLEKVTPEHVTLVTRNGNRDAFARAA